MNDLPLLVREVDELVMKLEAENKELVKALEVCLMGIKEYLEYEHDGDPWREDSRAMGEMQLDNMKRNGEYDFAIKALQRVKGEI
jgi:hypothetical protein